MNDNEKTQEYVPDTGDNDEVEIIEVVGVDEDLPAPSASLVDECDDSDDVVLTLDGDLAPEDDDLDEEPAEPPAPEVDPGVLETELVQRLRADYDNLRKRVSRE